MGDFKKHYLSSWIFKAKEDCASRFETLKFNDENFFQSPLGGY